MPAVNDLIRYYRTLVAEMAADVAAMEGGKLSLWEMTKDGRADVTPKWIDKKKARIANLNRLIAAYVRQETKT